MIGAVVAVYLAIGVLALVSPPGRAEIAKQLGQVRGSPFANAIAGRQAPPEWKVVAFGAIVAGSAVLLWPLLVSHLVQQWMRERRQQRRWEEERAKGLQYPLMGGAGVIACEQCGYREEIVSFTHGMTWGPDVSCTEGRQCLKCGKFHSVDRRGNPAVTPVPRCACGGELSRDHFLFCPECRSTRLRYGMSYIT